MEEKNKEIKENKKEKKLVEDKAEKVKENKKEEKAKNEKKTETPKTETKKLEVKNEDTKKNTWIGKTIVVIAVLVIAALLTFMIVTSSDPKKSVDGFLTNLKAGDFEKAQEFISGEELLKDEEYDVETKRLFFDKITWKVTKVTKENDNAIVEIEITNKDLKTVIAGYMQKVLKLALSGENITVEENKNYFMEELKNDQVQTTTLSKTIQLIKEDKKWKVVSNDELVNTLLPGFQEVVDSLGN